MLNYEEIVIIFIKIIQQEIDNMYQLTELLRKQAKLARKPWNRGEIRTSIRNKQKM